MGGDQLGFLKYELTIAKKRTEKGEVFWQDGSGCALAALA